MDLLDRLHARLTEAVARQRDLTAVTVGDVYQHLIPYRLVRGELGLWELAPYEHALLRLLSGERGYLTLDDARARDEIARELASPNPILGLYRDYAAVGVRLGGAPGAPPPAPPAPLPEPVPARVPTPASASAPPTALPAPGPSAAAPSGTPAAALAGQAAAERTAAAEPVARELAPDCRACGAALPGVEGLRFCPACGADQAEVPCARCGAPIRAEWNFCVRCGSRRPGEPAAGS